jgi:uncharacterized protein (TIGR03435 family)
LSTAGVPSEREAGATHEQVACSNGEPSSSDQRFFSSRSKAGKSLSHARRSGALLQFAESTGGMIIIDVTRAVLTIGQMNRLSNHAPMGAKVILILTLAMLGIPAITLGQAATPDASSSGSRSEPLPPMPPDANPAFDVATIKPSDTSAPHGTFIRSNGRHLIAYNMSVGELITYAYGLHAKQIVHASPVLRDAHFDIDGVPDREGWPNLTQSRLMFQKLLVSRFKLAFHYESRELPVYAIQIARSGPHLNLTTRKPGEGTRFSYTCQAVLTVRNNSVSDVAKGLQDVFLDRPVVDQTDLHDRYDFDLKWTPDNSQSYCPVGSTSSRIDPNAPPGLYTAFQEQLGLKIVSTKAPVQVMVIDKIESPSEN